MQLRTWRLSRDLSLLELAKRLGIEGQNPSQTVQRWETGARKPSLVVIKRIRCLTGDAVTVDDFAALQMRQRAIRQTQQAA